MREYRSMIKKPLLVLQKNFLEVLVDPTFLFNGSELYQFYIFK